MLRNFFLEQNHCFADCVAGSVQRDHVHKLCLQILKNGCRQNKENQSY